MQVHAPFRALTLGSIAPFCVMAVVLLFAILTSAPLAHAADDPVRALEVDAESVQSSVQVVNMDVKKSIARQRRYPLERRYLEAQMAYDLGHMTAASVLLVDLVNDGEFQRNRDYGDALFLLGDSLFRVGNYRSAKLYLDQVLRLPEQRNFQVALQERTEIALRLNQMEDMERHALQLDTLPPGPGKSELLYQFGRAFFLARAWDRAGGLLAQIHVDDKRWPAARFYIGATLVAQGKPDLAVARFRDVLDGAKGQDRARGPEPEVFNYANIALGRLYMQQKKYDDAAANYLAVDRKSPVYGEALFELAAAYVAGNKPKPAIDTLDLLLQTVNDDNLTVRAAALRGRIHMLNEQFDQADAAYQGVVDQYSAITGELTRFASSDKSLEQFFSWLLNRVSDEYQVQRPASVRVARYLEHDEDMRRVVSLFDDMAIEHADVKDCAKLAATLAASLKGSSGLGLFPELKDGWLRVVENQNRTANIGRRIVDLLRSFAEPNMNAEDRETARGLQERSRKWQEAFANVPATKDKFLERTMAVSSRIVDLGARVAVLRSDQEQARQQVLTLENVLNERTFGPATDIALSEQQEADIRQALQAEKDELRRSYRTVEQLNQDVEVASQGVGAGDKVSDDEAAVRAGLAAARRAEMDLYIAVLARAGGHDDETRRLQSVRHAIDLLGAQMRGILQTIGEGAGERVAAVRQVLVVEQRNIAEYQNTVRGYEDEARQMARDAGYGLIRKAEKRLADILVEADVGLVEVAWQRKQVKAETIENLQEQRSGRLKTLGDVLNDLTPSAHAEER